MLSAASRSASMAPDVHTARRRLEMASVASLREHLVDELNDLLNAEQQLIEALPQMADKASQRELKSAFRSHLAQTRTHERRVTQALKQLGEQASGKTCEAMEGLLEEGQELISSAEQGSLLDAMMITAAQKVEHYEIASYGTLAYFADLLGEARPKALLGETLDEEKAADEKLNQIAKSKVNREALMSGGSENESQAVASRMAGGVRVVGASIGLAQDKSASRRVRRRTTKGRGRSSRRRS
jgi:ferritin-like metal-binding protein YciE